MKVSAPPSVHEPDLATGGSSLQVLGAVSLLVHIDANLHVLGFVRLLVHVGDDEIIFVLGGLDIGVTL